MPVAQVFGNSLWELLCKRVELTPDIEIFVDDSGRRVTASDFYQRVEEMAAGLVELGLSKGDVVSWQLPTWVDSVVLAAALNRIDVLQNPILPIYREKEVGFCTKQAKSKLLIVPAEFGNFDFIQMAEGIARKNKGMEVLGVRQDEFPKGDIKNLPEPPMAPDNHEDLPIRWLLYTSGTTAEPKGALHADSSIAAVSQGMSARLGCSSDDRSILAFPFTHVGGLVWLFSALQFGVCKLLTESFNPEKTVNFMTAENATIAGSGTAFHLAYLNIQRENPDEPIFPNLRFCTGGGAPKPPQLHYEIKKELGGAGVISGWGLTEVPILTMGSVNDPDDKLAKTEGRALDGVDLRVVTANGEVAPAGVEGELRTKSPQQMRSYLDESKNAEAFDEEGYFKTGDLGIIDEDGFVVITGRLKDVIIRHGENISAKVIEDLLYEHPQIQDVAAIGLADEVTGERVCVIISTPDGKETISFDDMIDFLLKAGLRKQALPEQMILGEISRNASGKILKQVLKDKYADEFFER